MNDKKNCEKFLDQYFVCISKTEDYSECKLYLDMRDSCKSGLNQKKLKK